MKLHPSARHEILLFAPLLLFIPALVAIIGRPNVGKSTLFNRMVGERIAIESPFSGTTRDPITAFYEGEKVDMLFVDTGGLEFGEKQGTIEADVQAQAHLAIASADLILLCMEAKAAISGGDLEALRLLRKKAGRTPVFLVVTKAEGKILNEVKSDFAALAIGEEEPFFVSAVHNFGIADLLLEMENTLEQRGFQKDPPKQGPEVSIAVLGRPNVGKSSLVNALLNADKLIVSEVAGTTRDAVDIEMKREGKIFRLIDTAGIRRRGKISLELEHYSILRSLASLRRADVTFLVLDAVEGVTHQDKHIIEHVLEAKTGLILVINKADLLVAGEEARRYFLSRLKAELSFLPWAPAVFVSALRRKNISALLPLAQEIKTEREKRITTGIINHFLQELQQLHPMSGVKKAHPRIKYGTQVGVSPPHFVFHGGRLDALHFSSRRYLENRLRDAFGFVGTPLKIELVTSKNPYLPVKKVRSSAKERKEKRQKIKKTEP